MSRWSASWRSYGSCDESQWASGLRSFFFFQAEDGIRDSSVTGVQTCALPISWSALQGLNGAADANNKKTVEAGEFIDYVRSSVPSLTGSKQHPRDFGSIENATRLTDLTKAPVPITRFKTIWDSKAGEPLLLAH